MNTQIPWNRKIPPHQSSLLQKMLGDQSINVVREKFPSTAAYMHTTIMCGLLGTEKNAACVDMGEDWTEEKKINLQRVIYKLKTTNKSFNQKILVVHAMRNE